MTIRIFLIFIIHIFTAIYSTAIAAQTNHKQDQNMISIRKAFDRGKSEHSWLKSSFTFSFADYYDSKHMGFRTLRVINEDKIKSGSGFDPHPHKDMEIITYIIKGSLQHKDSLGNTSIIRAGEVQRMSAGTGVVHSEYNHEKDVETHLYQIWILPSKKSTQPSYAQKSFDADLKKKKLVLVVSGNARDGSIGIGQDADLYLSRLSKGDTINFDIRDNRYIWLQMIKGKLQANGQELNAGDGLNTSAKKITTLTFTALEDVEFLLFDLT